MVDTQIVRSPRAGIRATETRTDDFLQLALTYWQWGLRTFPLYGKDKPSVCWGRLPTARYSERFIGEMFGRATPDRWRRRTGSTGRRPKNIRGLAVLPGWCSRGLAVRDFDCLDAAKKWMVDHPEVARLCPISRTARGYHVYFRLPHGHKPIYVVGDDGELSANGTHYIVLPPSHHSDGIQYQWALSEPHSWDDFPVLAPAEHGLIPTVSAPKPKRGLKAKTRSTNRNTNTSCVAGTRKQTSWHPRSDSVDEIIDNCLPHRVGVRNECLWELARRLKSLPQFAETQDPECEELFRIVERWYNAAQTIIRTKKLKTCWSDFCRQFAQVEIPYGQGLALAVERSQLVQIPRHLQSRYIGSELKLLRLCLALQECAGRGTFFLSCRSAQNLCGFGSHHTAARRIKAFCEDGVLELDRRFDHAERKATHYRITPQSEDQK